MYTAYYSKSRVCDRKHIKVRRWKLAVEIPVGINIERIASNQNVTLRRLHVHEIKKKKKKKKTMEGDEFSLSHENNVSIEIKAILKFKM